MAEQQSVQFGSIKLPVYLWGRGSTVLLVHGWSGRGSQMAAFAEPLVNAGYRVITFDAPGHGQVSGPSRSNAFEFAASIMVMAERYGPFEAVIAHSFGVVGSLMALRDGMEVEKLLCISSPSDFRAVFDNFAKFLGLTDEAKQYLEQRYFQHFGKNVWRQVSPLENIRCIEQPVLVVHDQQDRDVLSEHGQRLADACPQGYYYQTSGLGHRRILRDTGVIQQCIQFVQGDEVHPGF